MRVNDEEPSNLTDFSAVDLHCEILCSYRLIFGQEKTARKRFKKLWQSSVRSDDPLLLQICSNPWRSIPIFGELDVPSVRTVYSAHDFPYLYKKLVDLQDYVNDQCPTGWTSLWRDRRDIGRFWTLWAALIFGVATIILTLVQISIGIVQIIESS